MNYLRRIFKKLWNNPAIKISAIYLVFSLSFHLLENYLYLTKAEASPNNFHYYTLSSLVLLLVTTIFIYYWVKNNVTKFKKLNNEKEVVLGQLKLFFDRMPLGVIIVDTKFEISNWNPAAEKIFGFMKDEVLGKYAIDFVIKPDLRQFIETNSDTLKKGNDISITTSHNITRKGNAITCSWHFISLFDEKNDIVGLMGVVNDISHRVKSEEELKILLSALEQNPASIIITSLSGALAYVNPKVIETTGYSKEELIGKNPENLFQSELARKEVNENLVQTLKAGKIWKGELLNKKKSGELYWAALTVAPVKNENGVVTHFVGVEEDITEKKQQDEQIKHSLIEKEIMLKEIHHRVKNNLQIISSLLNLQSQNIEDPEIRKVFNISRDRVQSMSLVHSQLYETNDLTDIDFKKYAARLANQLLLSYCGRHDGSIKINTKADGIRFGIDTAIPCGLILNELLVNSIKHSLNDSFNGKCSGIIDVEIRDFSGGKYLMTVNDDGSGMQNSPEVQDDSGMGMKLIEALTSQLNGSIHISTQRGTKFEIEFEEAKYVKRMELV